MSSLFLILVLYRAEIRSASMVIRAAARTQCRTVIAHVSAPETLKLVMEAKSKGIPVIAESCAHYLCFDKKEMNPFGVFARMKPPFRNRERVDQLAKYCKEGFIDIFGSDHAPYSKEEKLKYGNDIWNTFDGLPGLEFTLPLLLKLVDEEKLSYEMIARCFSENTAKFFRLPQKGRIETGRDADIVFVKKLPKEEKIDIGKLYCKCRDTAILYDSIPLRHKIIRTIYQGKTVYSGNGMAIEPGTAEILIPNSEMEE